MSILWDTLEELQANNDIEAVPIEVISMIAALSIVIVLFYLKKKYPKLTKKGFNEFIIGVIIFSGHFFFDLLDTLVTKKIAGKTTLAYLLFDTLDAILAFMGLFIIGYAFYRIAQYGMELWGGEK
ncbi:MAG: hypothetical protein ACTSRI_18635 [Promethearchaeota archaeon]